MDQPGDLAVVLTAQPSVRAPNIYRALMQTCGQYFAAKSVSRIITGT